MDKLIKLIESELNGIGAYKMSMPVLGAKEMWQKSGRWDYFQPEIFCFKDKSDHNLCLQPTHEEMVTRIVAEQGELRHSAYPLLLYQTGSKFRDETYAGYGLLRSREFLMNDLYSFDITPDSALKTYGLVSEAYRRIFFNRLGIDVFVVRAGSGHIGGNISHEYHLPSRTSRDSIVYCTKCQTGISSDLMKQGEKPCNCSTKEFNDDIETTEIAHTFQLGDLFTKKFQANYRGQPLVMNCFGIGIGRLVAALIDFLSPSAKTLRLPYALAPFKVAVILPNRTQCATQAFAQKVIGHLSEIPSLHDDIFVDDRLDNSIGKRLIAASNLGIPHILVIGNRTTRSLADNNPVVEYYQTEAHNEEPISVGDLQNMEVMKIFANL